MILIHQMNFVLKSYYLFYMVKYIIFNKNSMIICLCNRLVSFQHLNIIQFLCHMVPVIALAGFLKLH